jgi:hypothetical protein
VQQAGKARRFQPHSREVEQEQVLEYTAGKPDASHPFLCSDPPANLNNHGSDAGVEACGDYWDGGFSSLIVKQCLPHWRSVNGGPMSGEIERVDILLLRAIARGSGERFQLHGRLGLKGDTPVQANRRSNRVEKAPHAAGRDTSEVMFQLPQDCGECWLLVCETRG